MDSDGSSAPAHLKLGSALQAAGELPAAMESYERALALDPGYAAAHYNLALVHLLLSRHAEAEPGFRAALRLRGIPPEAWVGLADALEALGRTEDALLALGNAIRFRNDYAGALMNLGALLRRTGRLEEAAANYRRVARGGAGKLRGTALASAPACTNSAIRPRPSSDIARHWH